MKWLWVLLFSGGVLAQTNECPNTYVIPTQPVQDQDGLGTCYANVAALLLQHQMQSSPVSYQQIGIAHAMARRKQETLTTVRTTPAKGSNPAEEETRMASEGGNVCSAIRAVQEVGHCSAESFGVERHGERDRVRAQQFLLVELARFLDDSQESISADIAQRTPTYWRRVEHTLAYNLMWNQGMCAFGKERFIAFRLMDRLGRRIPDMDNPLAFQWGQRLFEHVALDSAGRREYRTPRLAVLDRVAALLRRPISEGERFLSSHYNTTDRRTDVTTISEDEILNQLAAQDNVSLSFGTNTGQNEQLAGDLAAWEMCQHGFGGVTSDLLRESLSRRTCENFPSDHPLFQPHLIFAQSIVHALQELGNGDLRSRGRALIGAVAPACYHEMERSQRPVGNRIRCTTTRVNARNGGVVGASNFIKRSLCERSPVSVSVCTGFMRQATTRVNSQFCTQDIPGVPNHGRHAMAVVGYSEGEAGQGRRFLVQNSWGGHCPSHAEAVGITCEKTLDGMNTGRWWIDQELLLNNSYRLERIPPPPVL